MCKRVYCLAIVIWYLVFGTAAMAYAVSLNSIELIIRDSDLHMAGEGLPSGVPVDWDWATHATIDAGNKPTTGFSAMTSWGQVYKDRNGSPDRNTRIQIRNMRAYMLSKSSRVWKILQGTSSVDGAAYIEDFTNDTNVPADTRVMEGGGVAVKLVGGHNYHFWPDIGRVEIDPSDIAGIFVTVQARLVVDDPKKPDDRAIAKYLLNVGGDYWRSLDASWKSNFSTNDGIGVGRFKYVGNEWKAFNYTTLGAQQIRLNPPPIE